MVIVLHSSTNYSVDDTADPPKLVVIGQAVRSPERPGAWPKARKGSNRKAPVADPSQQSQRATFVATRVVDKHILDEEEPPPTDLEARRKWLNHMRQRRLHANRAQQE